MFSGRRRRQHRASPTLYLHGNEDGAFGVEGVAAPTAKLSAESRVEIIDGVGHFLHLEKPAEINQLILDWLSAPTRPNDTRTFNRASPAATRLASASNARNVVFP